MVSKSLSPVSVEINRIPLDDCEAHVHDLQQLVVHLAGVGTVDTTVAMIVHEVAQPITAATNYLAAAEHLLSSDNPLAQDRGLDAVKHAQECLARTGALIGNAKDATARKAFSPCPQDLAAIVADVVLMFPPEAGVVPVIDIVAKAARVIGDGVQIGQVLSNLIRNAIEATEGQAVRYLRISSRPADRRFVEIRVEDNGPGIDRKIRDQLFSVFTSTKEEGLGVGLSICQTIIEQHQGRIWTEALPAGTAFCFTLKKATSARHA